MTFKNFISIVILMIGSSFTILAQEIKATVIVNTDQLQMEALNSVSSMANDVQNYINNNRFLETQWEGEPIPVEINIYLSGGRNNRFSGKMFIVSKRVLDGPKDNQGQSINLRLKEDTWSFEYSRGANFTYNVLRYDEFVSMIDFYMLLIIGYDLDTYGELDGNKAFDNARSIVNMGAGNNVPGFKSVNNPGDFTKYNLLSELQDMKNYTFRKIIFSYYVDGLDQLSKKKEETLKSIENILAEMVVFKQKLSGASVIMQLFFDTKAQELAAIFNSYPTRDVFNNLIYLDPSNTMLYQDSRDGKLK
jgi:hypothetical protein